MRIKFLCFTRTILCREFLEQSRLPRLHGRSQFEYIMVQHGIIHVSIYNIVELRAGVKVRWTNKRNTTFGHRWSSATQNRFG